MPVSSSEILTVDSLRVDDPAKLMPAIHSVADVADEADEADEASPEIMADVLDSKIVPALDDMTSIDQTPSLPSGGVFASDRMFVRENPW